MIRNDTVSCAKIVSWKVWKSLEASCERRWRKLASFYVGGKEGDIMTEKQKLFADEYLIDLNATRAYKAVYKNCKSDNAAAACAAKLSRNPKVKAYIDKRLEEIKSQKVAEAQEVMEYLTSVMRGESSSEVLRFVGDGYQDISKKAPDEKERLKAAELLGKRYRLFTDKIEAENNALNKLDELIEAIDYAAKQ